MNEKEKIEYFKAHERDYHLRALKLGRERFNLMIPGRENPERLQEVLRALAIIDEYQAKTRAKP